MPRPILATVDLNALRHNQARARQAAPDGSKMTIDLKKGDKVIYSKYSGTEIEHQNENLVILPYRDIFAKIVFDDGVK